MVQIDDALVQKWAPVLVLYPDITIADEGRPTPEIAGFPRHSPMPYDYHPRDIRLPIDNSVWYKRRRTPWSRLFPGSKTLDGEKMLREMAEGKDRDLDLLPDADQHKAEAFWTAYQQKAAMKDSDGNEIYPRRCYANVHQDTDGVTGAISLIIQYWYPYFYNDFWNKHEMDWETVMIVLSERDGEWSPTVVALSAHEGGYWLPWSQVEKSEEDSSHPVIYVGAGSHANYFYGPARYETASPMIRGLIETIPGLPFIRLFTRHSRQLRSSRTLIDFTIEHTPESGFLVEPELIPQNSREWTGKWGWLKHKGKWGSPGGGADLQFGDNGPKGPPWTGEKWEDPLTWIVRHCRQPDSGSMVVPVVLQ